MKDKVKTLIDSYRKDDFIDKFSVVNEEDEVDTCWGVQVFKITLKDIEALKSGKRLYFNNDEYAGVIFLGEEE